ncbi:2-C-methyl-D-erythritol 4-phosphate cytidylyltransferase [Noviherbaspirillum aridicola]|uniref:2-C-methyl-D-erythritol 4-phosphate cytidylyltransferase n=1 Tax=Noviherbaspirillum aridicola TaxID=2849687 RepID=A0ABQ4Q1V6_9BURK|nr:2-C-methyl-D-erythritol 4-phosphate cytidylyltransferase [Noviherbaspirillum aridicola]GIZ51166.1 2-C-methyl-D-erythritol 4-phosphate cytidylyltransferase [Noviherbaspirillum aridicola]
MNPARHFALIPAAGVGSRMGASHPKQYLDLAGKPVLAHVIDTFHAAPSIAGVVVVVSPEDGYIDDLAVKAGQAWPRLSIVRKGGATRRESVLGGLRALADHANEEDWVLVHDAARPGLTVALIERLAHALAEDRVGGLLALPVVDTLKRSDDDGRAERTVPREQLWAAQTPQMFRHGLLTRALEQAPDVTDEAGAIERLGLKPKLVEGSPRNFKITLPHDLALAELHMKGLG